MGLFRKSRKFSSPDKSSHSGEMPRSNEEMIQQQIVRRGITTPSVLEAFRKTDRRMFVPDTEMSLVYQDRPIPLMPGATVSQPYIVALMTDLLRVGPDHRVLEIGTGSGYQAAVLSHLVKEVYGVELQPELVEFARTRIRQAGCDNVMIIQGNGWNGYAQAAPYDRIIVTAAAETLPQALIEQLVPGGRMVVPVGAKVVQALEVIDKSMNGDISRATHSGVQFVPLVDED